MNYTANELIKGEARKRELEETDQTFEKEELGAGGKRKAGPEGARAVALMTDPIEQENSKQWMDLFGLSNQGAEFEQAKIQKAEMGLI